MVLIRSSTFIALVTPSSTPACSANAVFGRTPVERSTKSDVTSLPSDNRTLWSVISVADTPVNTVTPCFSSSSFTYTAMSLSSPGVTCGNSSINVTSIPRPFKFSHTSSPIKPVPTMAADFGRLVSIYDFILIMSLILRRVKTFSLSAPLIGGTTALAPVAITSLSY